MGRDHAADSELRAKALDHGEFFRKVRIKAVDRHDQRQAQLLLEVLDMAAQIGQTGFECLQGVAGRVLRCISAAMVFQGPHGGDEDSAGRLQIRLAAFDVDELLGTEISAKAGLGDDIVGQLQGGTGGDDRVAAVRNIGEGPAMDKGRCAFQRLHQVWRQRVLEQRGHRAVGFQVTRRHVLAGGGLADDDVAEPAFQVGERARQADDRHHLGGDNDVETVLAREAVGRAAQTHRDVTQGAVVHVHDTSPADAARIQRQRIAMVDMVVDQCR